jgi:hypothetical protein
MSQVRLAQKVRHAGPLRKQEQKGKNRMGVNLEYVPREEKDDSDAPAPAN